MITTLLKRLLMSFRLILLVWQRVHRLHLLHLLVHRTRHRTRLDKPRLHNQTCLESPHSGRKLHHYLRQRRLLYDRSPSMLKLRNHRPCHLELSHGDRDHYGTEASSDKGQVLSYAVLHRFKRRLSRGFNNKTFNNGLTVTDVTDHYDYVQMFCEGEQ